jgi:xylulokinase
MSYLLGLDIGTSGAKALLCNEKGEVLATALAEYPIYSPYPLWSEQEPADWWDGARKALRQVMANAGVRPEEIAGLGLTGQMHGAVFLDRNGDVIRRALLWNDQRTAAECAEITEKIGAARLIEIAGNPALTGFQAPKIVWLRNHEPENFARIAAVLLPKDFIRLKLTGVMAADASDAAGTLLLDLRTRDYSPEILEKLGFQRSWLPKVFEGPEITGKLLPEVAKELGLPAGLPVIAGGGDNAAAAVGTGVVRSGVVSSSIGTSGVLFAYSDGIALDPKGRLHTFCHTVPGKYHLMAVTLSAGGSFQWLRNLFRSAFTLAGIPDAGSLGYDQLTAAAAAVAPGAEGLVFLPYLTGERTPHLDPLASGAFVGLTARHSVGHISRAVMEGVVYSLRDGLDIMRALGVPVDQIRATGGGGRSPLWRQMQADIYGAEVVSLRAEEGPAYGAALLAGVGAGVFDSVVSAASRSVAVVSSTLPNPETAAIYDRVYSVYTQCYPAMKAAMHDLGAIAQG